MLALHWVKMLHKHSLTVEKVRSCITILQMGKQDRTSMDVKTFKSSSERILTSANHSVHLLKPFASKGSTVLHMCFRCLHHSPELVCHEDDAALQQEGGEDADDLPHAEALEEALKVHVFQAGVHGPPQLDDLHTPNKQQSAGLGQAGSAECQEAQPGAPARPRARLLRGHRMNPSP